MENSILKNEITHSRSCAEFVSKFKMDFLINERSEKGQDQNVLITSTYPVPVLLPVHIRQSKIPVKESARLHL